MGKILLSGVAGNLGSRAAEVLLERHPHEDLIFASSTEGKLARYQDQGIQTRVANYHDADSLAQAFAGVDTAIIVSVPFVGPKRREAHKCAIDAAVAAGVERIVYTSVVGAGDETIDTYEVNDHVWTEDYLRSQPIHWLILRNSQYAEAMTSAYLDAVENTGGVLANNMGEGKMAFVSRDDCARAAAMAALSDWRDRVINVNGTELMTVSRFIQIGNEVTGEQVEYRFMTDEENYAFFDSIGVPRTTEEMWADTAKNFPYCSDGMISFGRALRQGQMAEFTDDFEQLTGQKPLSVRQIFEDLDAHLVGERVSTDS